MITWEEWEATYKPTPFKPEAGEGYWQAYFDSLEDIPTGIAFSNIWTMIDGNGRYANIINGAWHGNSLGYFVTDLPWTEDVLVTNDKEMYA